MTQPTKRDARKQELLEAGVKLAVTHGYNKVTPLQISELVGCSRPLVCFYFSTTNQLHRAIVGEALRVHNLPVIAQALVNGDPRAKRAPDTLKREALDALLVRG